MIKTINVHAGHGADGSKSCGATGLIKESTEARKVKDLVIKLLKEEGLTVYDCTVDYPNDAKDCLNKIVSKCNAHKVDLDISIHFNAGANKLADNATTGVEVLTYNSSSKANPYAKEICARISKLGFKNRGVKHRTNLAVLKTNNPNLLIECCFVDDPDDIKIYDHEKMARAIVEGILGRDIEASKPAVNTPNNNNEEIYYRVVVGSYKSLATANSEVEKAKAKGYSGAFVAKYVK